MVAGFLHMTRKGPGPVRCNAYCSISGSGEKAHSIQYLGLVEGNLLFSFRHRRYILRFWAPCFASGHLLLARPHFFPCCDWLLREPRTRLSGLCFTFQVGSLSGHSTDLAQHVAMDGWRGQEGWNSCDSQDSDERAAFPQKTRRRETSKARRRGDEETRTEMMAGIDTRKGQEGQARHGVWGRISQPRQAPGSPVPPRYLPCPT